MTLFVPCMCFQMSVKDKSVDITTFPLVLRARMKQEFSVTCNISSTDVDTIDITIHMCVSGGEWGFMGGTKIFTIYLIYFKLYIIEITIHIICLNLFQKLRKARWCIISLPTQAKQTGYTGYLLVFSESIQPCCLSWKCFFNYSQKCPMTVGCLQQSVGFNWTDYRGSQWGGWRGHRHSHN